MNQPSGDPPPRTLWVPDTLLILFALAVLAWGATWAFAPGRFALDGGTPLRIVAESYVAAAGPDGAPLFGTGDNVGLIDFLFAGLVTGGPASATVGLFAFILVVGGVFGIILRTGVVEAALMASLPDGRVRGETLIVLLFIASSLGGAVFGMGEEAIAISLILVPALVRAGYDSITGLVACYVATQIGFATSWMNPFSVIVAQSIAGVPPMSGMGFRIVMWAVFTAIGALFLWRYGRRVRLSPERSIAFASDARWREDAVAVGPGRFGAPHAIILALLILGLVWVGWGVVARGYYLAEIAAQFFAIAIAIALVARIFRVGGVDANALAEAFRDGAVQLAPAGLVVAAAKGIVLILGGDDPARMSLLNSLLHGMSGAAAALPDWLTAWGMLAFQSAINIFIVSGSGQASVTMPLMAPLADLAGVTRQTAILAFQLGDGITNIVVPTSAALMGCLAAARLDFVTWLRFIWRPLAALFLIESAFVVAAQAIGYA
jgi:uncharacterized ion transporter superfamily protein YfcC